MGCEIGGRGEEDAVFEVRGKEVFAAGDISDKAARVFGAGKIAAIRNHVRWGSWLICPMDGATEARAPRPEIP
jgi:hypothetical protein